MSSDSDGTKKAIYIRNGAEMFQVDRTLDVEALNACALALETSDLWPVIEAIRACVLVGVSWFEWHAGDGRVGPRLTPWVELTLREIRDVALRADLSREEKEQTCFAVLKAGGF